MKKNRMINGSILFTCMVLVIIGTISVVKAQNSVFILSDCSVLSSSQQEILEYFFIGLRVATPVLIVVLVMKDFVQAIASQKDEDMKKAQSTAIKRIIIGVIIMFVPTIVNLLLDLMGQNLTTCGIK